MKMKERKNKMITINPELYENKNIYRYGHEKLLVKIFPSTIGWKVKLQPLKSSKVRIKVNGLPFICVRVCIPLMLNKKKSLTK